MLTTTPFWEDGRGADRILRATRDRQPLPAAAIEWFVRGFLDGRVPDYQMAAWLMAVTLNGLTEAETWALTRAMFRSGAELDWSDLRRPVVDKHSSGGVGDKITLVAVPTAAAAGVLVPKLSGRGLGFTGGTLDKLESIPGFRTRLPLRALRRQVEAVGCAIAAASPELAPADKRLYALRDVTATAESIPLVASSIMSKKLAGGATGIVLDVKAGIGAVMATAADARALAEQMVSIGQRSGRRVVAVLSRMDEPLGAAVGNALEVREALEVLHGGGPADVRELALLLAGWMVCLAGLAPDPAAGTAAAAAALADGAALRCFRAMVAAQGGDPSVVDEPDRLPQAPHRLPVRAAGDGWVAALDAREVGLNSMALGAGRARTEDDVDPAVGVLLHKKTGDRVRAGELLAEVHVRAESDPAGAAERLRASYRIEPAPVPVPPLVLGVIEA